jgi:hypothetical protein
MSREQIVQQLQEFMERAKNRMVDVTPQETEEFLEAIPVTLNSEEPE